MAKPNPGNHGDLDPIRDAYFDRHGRLIVTNERLAREIQFRMTLNNGRLKVAREVFPEEKALEIKVPKKSTPSDRRPFGGGKGEDDTVTGTMDSGHPVNMMCPCAPEIP